MQRVDITARSLAEAASLEALSDVASTVDDWDGLRIVGGQMVHIHTVSSARYDSRTGTAAIVGGWFEDPGLRRSGEGRCVFARGPDLLTEKPDERFRLVGGVEVEIDDDVVGVIDRPLDAVPEHTGPLPEFGEPVECPFPEIEIDDRMFDVQCRHDDSLAGGVWLLLQR
jgi:hypothetical protein